MQKIQMVDLQGQYHHIKPEIDSAIAEVLEKCNFINGEPVQRFAQNLAHFLGIKHVIPCANGTDALQIALMALNLQPGDEVITTPFTFVATAEVIGLLRLKPVFVDVHHDTFNINEAQLEKAITNKTKCIVPVHLFGQIANMESIMDIANKHGIAVVEDNAQAIGADYTFSDGKIQKAGGIGQIGTTSFFPSKNLGGYGDGGALFTNDDTLASRINMIVNHGQTKRYYYDEIGVNSRLDTLQAVILDIKLKHLEEYAKARQKAAAFYNKHFQGIEGVAIPKVANFTNHVYHQYTLKLDQRRDEVMNTLLAAGIPCAIYYPVPLHIQNAYRHYGFNEGDFPVSEMLAQKVLSLPMHTELTEEMQIHIINTLITAYNN